jgi:hypothetical protein
MTAPLSGAIQDRPSRGKLDRRQSRTAAMKSFPASSSTAAYRHYLTLHLISASGSFVAAKFSG